MQRLVFFSFWHWTHWFFCEDGGERELARGLAWFTEVINSRARIGVGLHLHYLKLFWYEIWRLASFTLAREKQYLPSLFAPGWLFSKLEQLSKLHSCCTSGPFQWLHSAGGELLHAEQWQKPQANLHTSARQQPCRVSVSRAKPVCSLQPCQPVPWGCLPSAKGAAAAASAPGDPSTKVGPLPALGFGAASRESLAKTAGLGSKKALFKGEEVSKSGSPGSWAPGLSHRGQQPNPHVLVPIGEKCWELGVAGVCDMPHCNLGVEVLVPLPPRTWSFPWVSYLVSVCNSAKGERWRLLFPCTSAVVKYWDLYKHAEGGKKSVVCFPVRTYSCRS